MKVSWSSTHDNRIGFHTELHEYDAVPPVAALLIDHAPAMINAEREAVASYLAFGHWVSGDLQLAHKVGPNTASAIERDMSFVDVRPSPLEYYPKPLPTGSRRVSVDFDGSGVSSSGPFISVLPASRWNGALRSHNGIALGSNAFVFDAAASGGHVAIRCRLAVAVLFAEDLLADTFVLRANDVDAREISRIRKLLAAVNIGLDLVS